MSHNNYQFFTKEPPNSMPTFTGADSLYRATLKRLPRAPMTVAHDPDTSKAHGSREMVRSFLSALSPYQPPKPPILSKDLGRLSRILRSVYQAVDEDILTEEEANAVMNFVAECFTRRRLDEVFSKVTKPKSGAWFLIHQQTKEE